MCRVEFSKIGKRDVTFIREMRVYEKRNHSYSTLSPGHQKGDDVCPDAQAYLQTKLPTLAFNPVKSFQMRKNVQKSFEIEVDSVLPSCFI